MGVCVCVCVAKSKTRHLPVYIHSFSCALHAKQPISTTTTNTMFPTKSWGVVRGWARKLSCREDNNTIVAIKIMLKSDAVVVHF